MNWYWGLTTRFAIQQRHVRHAAHTCEEVGRENWELPSFRHLGPLSRAPRPPPPPNGMRHYHIHILWEGRQDVLRPHPSTAMSWTRVSSRSGGGGVTGDHTGPAGGDVPPVVDAHAGGGRRPHANLRQRGRVGPRGNGSLATLGDSHSPSGRTGPFLAGGGGELSPA